MNAFTDDPEQTPLLPEYEGRGAGHAAHPAGLDIEQAVVQANERLARQGDGSLYPLSIGVRELGKLGVGIGLYFNFVFYLACILAALSLLSLPSIISNSNGGVAENAVEQLSGLRAFFVKISLGNHAAGKPLIMDAVFDLCCSLLLLSFLFVYKKQQALSGKEIEVKNITASDYSVWVQDLPADATEEEVEAWLRPIGEIHSVLLSRANAHVISLLHEKEELHEEFQHCSALQQLGTNVQEARKQLAALRRRLDAIANEIDSSRDRSYLCSGHAFVTFSQQSRASKCIVDYASDSSWWDALPFVGSKNSAQPASRMFRQRVPVTITRAPQPSDILWEGLPCGSWERFFRQVATSLLR